MWSAETAQFPGRLRFILMRLQKRKSSGPLIRSVEWKQSYETVILHFEDIRDNYIEEEVLGRIGTINISRGFFQIVPEDDFEYLEKKEDIIDEAIEELFGTTNIEENSNKYYEKIKEMITDGTLETFGYVAVKKEHELDDLGETYTKKRKRRY